jgi:hypothetical protein
MRDARGRQDTARGRRAKHTTRPDQCPVYWWDSSLCGPDPATRASSATVRYLPIQRCRAVVVARAVVAVGDHEAHAPVASPLPFPALDGSPIAAIHVVMASERRTMLLSHIHSGGTCPRRPHAADALMQPLDPAHGARAAALSLLLLHAPRIHGSDVHDRRRRSGGRRARYHVSSRRVVLERRCADNEAIGR